MKSDLPEVEALLRSCTLPVGGIGEHALQFHVSRDKSGLLGCAGIEEYGGTVGLLRGLAVAERARCAGLGELLMSALVADVRQRGLESLVLRTETAAGYFSRFGFTKIPRSEVPHRLLVSREFAETIAARATVMAIAL
ncbi:GNAT family N-acetyltransferase [Cupriavidus basilensis]|uniref:GNAT family N-acetyltransferase n=1 Tax=Cupriavidus basilensis TaxID=68895 RepID=A0ABT6AT48_9BURK|nr:GNAT family N-acetyltransferase [Cupriavidus basilensis]MDF3834851.1 GNAT family N-acetyltransferase [Cupriavidus basilensis]